MSFATLRGLSPIGTRGHADSLAECLLFGARPGNTTPCCFDGLDRQLCRCGPRHGASLCFSTRDLSCLVWQLLKPNLSARACKTLQRNAARQNSERQQLSAYRL